MGPRPPTQAATAPNTVPPQEPGRHGWAELLTLVGDLRHLAYDRSLDADDRARRLRDLLGVYDGCIDDTVEDEQ